MKSNYSLMTRLLKISALSVCVATTSVACATAESTAVATTAPSKASTGQLYHWYDGDKKRSLRIAPDFVANFGQKEILQQTGSQKSVGAKSSPVFVHTKGSQSMRALPGGVIVRFRQAVDQGQADEALKQFGTHAIRPIGGTGKSWLVHADPGVAALDLANKIYESGLVQSASPNWWQERSRK